MSVDLLYASYVYKNRMRPFAGKKQFSRYLKKYLNRRYKDFGAAQVLKWQVPIEEGKPMGLPSIEGVSDAEMYWCLFQARDSRSRVFLIRGVTCSPTMVIPREALLLFHLSKNGG